VLTAQITFHDLIALFSRRKMMVIIPVIIVTILCIIGAYILPNKYESSTSILVQRDEILNPLISYEIAVAMASEDRLRTFNEIIYSHTNIQRLIDSLGLDFGLKTEEQRQALVDAVGKNIATERRGPDSFRISYLDTDPLRAQHAVSLIANMFIDATLHVEGQRNEQAVQFFQRKLDELRQKYESSQKQFVSRLQEHINSTPEETKTVTAQVQNIEKQIEDLDAKEKMYKQETVVLQSIPTSIHTGTGKQALYDLQRADLPFAADLKELLTKYDDYLRHYTPKYPEVQNIEKQILRVLDRMQKGVEMELTKLEPRRKDLEVRRAQLIDEIKQYSIDEHMDEDKESDYNIYRKLYDDMKIKLEQAVTARDLGNKGANQFIILDPPLVPTHPSKPNRIQIIIGGIFVGLFIGFITAILREMLDTTVRAPRDIEVYQKPVIAFITEGDEYPE
jgi:succinoglycan biosynthesis transport protein ExoP